MPNSIQAAFAQRLKSLAETINRLGAEQDWTTMGLIKLTSLEDQRRRTIEEYLRVEHQMTQATKTN